MADDIPAEWRVLLERRGVPVSYRGLGDRAGIAHETARRLITGRETSPVTVRKVAAALGVDPEKLHELRGETAARAAVWEPPAVSALLTGEERELLARLVHALTAGRDFKEREHRGDTAPTSPPVTVAETAESVPLAEPSRGGGRRPPGAQPA